MPVDNGNADPGQETGVSICIVNIFRCHVKGEKAVS